MIRWAIVTTTWLFLVAFVCLPGCTKVQVLRADASGFGGAIGANNARPRCQIKKEGDRLYEVFCRAVIITPSGEEIIATSIQNGFDTDWPEPVKMDGSDIVLERRMVSKLSQRVSVRMATDVPTTIRFDFTTIDLTTLKRNTESEPVTLPLSVESFGAIAALLPYVANDPIRLGVQNISMPPLETYVGQPTSVCVRGNQTFFSAEQTVYVVEKGQMKLFAGSSNPANKQQFSHRLRIAFTYIKKLACAKDAIYVADRVDGMNYRVVKVAESGPLTVLLTQAGTSADFTGLAADESGNLFFNNGNSIEKLDASGVRTRITGDIRTSASSGDGGPAVNAMLSLPRSIAIAKDGSLYIAEPYGIRRIDTAGIITTIAGTGDARSVSGDGGPAAQAALGGVQHIALGPSGDLYLLGGFSTSSIRRIDPLGYIYSAMAEVPASRDLAVEPSGALLLADSTNLRIGRIEEGVLSTAAGKRVPNGMAGNRSYDSTTAQFGRVTGLAIGPDDSIYAADRGYHQIYKIDPSGKVTVLAGTTGKPGYGGEDTPATESLLNAPADILLSNGILTIADTNNKRIRQILPDGNIVTLAHSPDISPKSLAMNESGRLYYANEEANLYRFGFLDETNTPQPINAGIYQNTAEAGFIVWDNKILFSNGISTLFTYNLVDKLVTRFAGTFAQGFSGDRDLATNALLNKPYRIVRDEESIYVADSENGRIRRIFPNGSGGHNIETFLGGDSKIDCSGAIKRNLTPADMEKEIQVSLSAVCYSKPLAFKIRKHCAPTDTDRHITMAVSQSFGRMSNVIRIKKPCP